MEYRNAPIGPGRRQQMEAMPHSWGREGEQRSTLTGSVPSGALLTWAPITFEGLDAADRMDQFARVEHPQ